LLGEWKLLNYCKPPYNWLSSWSGDYKNSLNLIHAIQGGYVQNTVSHKAWLLTLSDEDKKIYSRQFVSSYIQISHLHYSGRGRIGSEAIDDFMFSNQTDEKRMRHFYKVQSSDLFYITFIKNQSKRIRRKLKQLLK
jgi:hypothetical protein